MCVKYEQPKTRRFYEIVKSLETENMKLKKQLERLSEKKEPSRSITPESAKKELKELFGKAFGYIKPELSLTGCEALVHLKGSKIEYGIGYDDKNRRGFHKQGELSIPKHLQNYVNGFYESFFKE